MSLSCKLAPRLNIPHPFEQIMGGAQIWAASVRGEVGKPAKSAKIITIDGWRIRIDRTPKTELERMEREARKPTKAEDYGE